MIDEEALRERNRWKSTAEVPNLPFHSFADLQAALTNRSYDLEVSYVAARELAPFVRSAAGRLLNLALLTAPVVAVAALILGAVLSHHYLLLLGIPIAMLGSFLGNPLNPLRRAMTALNGMLLACLPVAYFTGHPVAAGLLAAFVLPFVANRLMYGGNTSALRSALAQSEALWLNQYSKGGVRLRNRQTGEIVGQGVGA